MAWTVEHGGNDDFLVIDTRGDIVARCDTDINARRIVAMREALVSLAQYGDESANATLKKTGSYGAFDEPNSVAAARAALQGDK